MGAYLASSLASLDGIEFVRGEGLLRAAVLAEGLRRGSDYDDGTLRGLIINEEPVAGVLRFAPPYIITEDDVDAAVAILKTVLDEALADQAATGR